MLFAAPGGAATVSPLAARGYALLPEPQKIELGAAEFRFGPDWRVEPGSGVSADGVAVETLREELETRFHLRLREGGAGHIVRLAIASGSVEVGAAADRDRNVLSAQAYRLELAANAVTITANAPQGLFYGVETLLQLLKPGPGGLFLPEGRITDWPDLQWRAIYWDDAHHLDHMDVLKHAIRQAAFFKANGFVIKLEGHFQYRSAPALVEPYALTPAEFQELTDYGLRYYVQVTPYLDGPAHIAFILKHPEYIKLRAFPDSNYQLCATNPESYQLLFGMFQDLLDANKGVDYFYLSTDEPYYIGLADNAQCREAARARELGSVGKLLAEFVTKTADYLHQRGRRVIFWGEYPMKPADLSALPAYMINGEVYSPEFDRIFKQRGMREMIYTSSEGEEKMFPNYFVLPAAQRLHPDRSISERVAETFRKISFDSSRQNADLMGMINAGWADMGLHPETFWLGYATAVATGWHPGSPEPREAMSAFYPQFYGWDAMHMDRIYQLMSLEAQFWEDSWDRVDSKARKPIWGNSERIYQPRRPAHDQSIPLPPAPAAADLSYASTWAKENARRLELAAQFQSPNDELVGLLHMNLAHASRNRYNLEVFLAIANLYRQNLQMLLDLGRMDSLLQSAAASARGGQARRAVGELDQALGIATRIRNARNAALADATGTWYKSWHPRVAEANGRKFRHELDDVKDHLPDRTIDMSYLVYRQLLLPFGEWTGKIRAARNEYARAHHLPVNEARWDWKDLTNPSGDRP